MALFGRRKPTVGLDIGSGLVKAAVIDHSGAEPELVGAAVTHLSSDAIVDGEVMDPGVVAEAIRSCLERAGAKGRRDVVTAVGGRDVIVKKIHAERASEKEAREVMRWEAQQHVPFDDLDAVELDFQILDAEEDTPQMSVLLVAAKRELIEAKLQLLADAGATASVVDVDAFALHNAFELSHSEAMSGIVALVNIGHEVTNINIVENGVPVLTRDVAVGTRRLREDLQRERGLTADDSAALLIGYDRSPHVDAVLPERVEEIALTVERAAAFLFSNMRTGAALRTVYTAGGGSRVPGLNGVLSQRLRTSVEAVNPLSSLSIRPGALGDLIVDDVAPLLLLPVGLALRQN